MATDPRQLDGRSEDGGARTRRARLAAATLLGAIAAAFAILNTKEVRINWILGTWSTPLIIVIAVSFLVGVAADRLAVVRARRRSDR